MGRRSATSLRCPAPRSPRDSPSSCGGRCRTRPDGGGRRRAARDAGPDRDAGRAHARTDREGAGRARRLHDAVDADPEHADAGKDSQFAAWNGNPSGPRCRPKRGRTSRTLVLAKNGGLTELLTSPSSYVNRIWRPSTGRPRFRHRCHGRRPALQETGGSVETEPRRWARGHPDQRQRPRHAGAHDPSVLRAAWKARARADPL